MLIAFPLQQRLHERASALRYTYIACLVKIYVSFLYFGFASPLASEQWLA